MPRYHNINGIMDQFTAEEETARDAEIKAWEDGKLARKQAEMRIIRDRYLAKTDYVALSDTATISDNMSDIKIFFKCFLIYSLNNLFSICFNSWSFILKIS